MFKMRSTVTVMLAMSILLSGFAPHSAMAQDSASDSEHQIHLPVVMGGNASAVSLPVGNQPHDVEQADVPVDEMDSVEKMWTSEMLLSAEPMDLLMATDSEIQAASQATDEMPEGPAGSAPSGAPDPDAEAMAQKLFAADWALAAEIPVEEQLVQSASMQSANLQGFSSRPPFTSYYVNKYTRTWKGYPWRATGRLFYNVPGVVDSKGKLINYTCTASVATGRAVWTAGHCVHTKGKGWHINMVFVPGYRNGAAPYGRFTVYTRTSLRGWTRDANLAYDIAMVAVRDRKDGNEKVRKVSEWVGWLGFMYNKPVTQLFHSLGYPSNLGNRGRYLIACVGANYNRHAKPGPDPIGMGCDMGKGASGGPWIVGYTPFVSGRVNYINGINSYLRTATPNVMYTPYFGNSAKALYDWGVTKSK